MAGTVIVYGGKGGLGQVVVSHFKVRQDRKGLSLVDTNYFKSLGYKVLSVDIGANEAADMNVCVSLSHGWVEQEKAVLGEVASLLGDSRVQAIINVAGGWVRTYHLWHSLNYFLFFQAGGNASSADWVKNADLMWKQSVWSSSIAASLAARFLTDGGLLVGVTLVYLMLHLPPPTPGATWSLTPHLRYPWHDGIWHG